MKDTDTESGPGAGHNSIGVDEEQFHGFVAQLANTESEMEIVQSKRKRIRKHAKAAGIRLGDLDFALKVRNLDDSEAREKLQHTATYLRWLKAAPGVQFELFGGSSGDFLTESEDGDDEALLAKVEGDGFVAGLTGKPDADNPHEANTPAGQRWIKGKRSGAESAQSGLLKVPSGDDDD